MPSASPAVDGFDENHIKLVCKHSGL